MKLRIRKFRRILGRFLDWITIIDQLVSRKESLFKFANVEGFDLDKIGSSRTLLIYGSFLQSVDQIKEEDIFLAQLEKNWTVIKLANSEKIDSASGWLIRQNKGRDLALFREFLDRFTFLLADKNVLWFNSSCVWNVDLLEKYIRKLEKEDSPVVTSLTDSWIGGYHLQSYFLFFNHRISKIAFDVFIDTIDKNWHFKRTVVHRGERRLTNNFSRFGIGYEVLFPTRKIAPEDFLWTNTYSDCQELLTDLDFPGVKKLSN